MKTNEWARKDILYFDLILLFLLVLAAVALLYAPATGSLDLFIPLAGVLFTMIFSYSIGMEPGLIMAIVMTFLYGSYMIYNSKFAHPK